MQTAMRISSVLGREANPRSGKHEPLYYLDLNAVAPETARQIGALFQREDQVSYPAYVWPIYYRCSTNILHFLIAFTLLDEVQAYAFHFIFDAQL